MIHSKLINGEKCGGEVERWRRIFYDKDFNKTSIWSYHCKRCNKSVSAEEVEDVGNG